MVRRAGRRWCGRHRTCDRRLDLTTGVRPARGSATLERGGGQLKVLVVDDERAIRESLDRALRLSGYDVALATDGLDALRAIVDDGPDAVVLDAGMPGPDGLAVARRLRRDGHDLPILMLTARDAIDDRVAGLDAGADDYLVKPFAFATPDGCWHATSSTTGCGGSTRAHLRTRSRCT